MNSNRTALIAQGPFQCTAFGRIFLGFEPANGPVAAFQLQRPIALLCVLDQVKLSEATASVPIAALRHASSFATERSEP
jgi:hypothetical protein